MITDRKQSVMDVAILLMRLMLAVVFIYHGSQKLFGWFGGGGLGQMTEFLTSISVPMPRFSAVLAACAEFFGGLSLLLGFGMRVIPIFTIITMLVASFTVHGKAFSAQHNGMEYPLTLAVMLLGLVLLGPGRLSLSHIVRKKVKKRVPLQS